MENIALAHEVTRDLNKKVRGHNIILKLDLSKAYDRVKWSFLHEAMRAFGFEEIWIDLIYRLINNCWYSVKVQNQIFGHFKAGCGLRQGDPLSPALFIMVLDVFSRNLEAKINQHKIQNFLCSRRSKAVSHLLFADDILLFSNGSLKTVKNIKRLIEDFSLASGQILNYEKSRFFISDKASMIHSRRIQNVLNFQKGSLPTIYLGVPLFCGRAKVEYFEFILDKIRRKISGWKSKMLSWGGKLITITSILNSIPIYAMSVLPVPRKILSQIQSCSADFLWNQGEDKRHHWVAWDKVTKPIEAGGLNLKLLSEVSYYWKSNLAWSFNQNKSLWATFMNHKYKTGVYSVSDSKLWRGIEPICAELLENSFWKIGEGLVNFWSQKWWPMDTSLGNNYNLPDDSIKNIWNDDRRKSDYIAALPTDLQIFARGIQLNNGEDKLIWKPAEDGIFKSRSFRQMHQDSPGNSWWKNFWRPWIPTKCSYFLWKCLNKAVPVDELIQRAKIPLASKCICCDSGHEETLDHLMLYSDTAKKVWLFLHRIFGMQFHYQSISQAAFVWVSNETKSQLGSLKVLAFTVAIWEIWKWRNKCIFDYPEDSSCIIHKIVHHLQQLNGLINPSRKANWIEELAISGLHLPVNYPKVRRGKWIFWSPSLQGLTLNLHGIISSIGQGGYLVRDSSGIILQKGYWVLPRVQDIFGVLLCTLQDALDRAESGGLRIEEIQSDSTKLIQCLQGNKSPPWAREIQVNVLRRCCKDLTLKAIERERNLAAIELVNSGDKPRSELEVQSSSV